MKSILMIKEMTMPHCRICGGFLKWLGRLGKKTWFRCEDCGTDQSHEINDLNEEGDDDVDE
jgi:tRNA(Ile2) C34 agmatinyltransferase TiaS